ncbi:H-2 class I histocompatibility antigen, Q9 alpha chain-like isoform X2 [Mauremys mutica]|uniref:H-2 class I histocompatibility antigen, Q9 alpha chain-like isoform X2 n=1 Tax=Mauremys mutica TaxID=74926 RepID=UPI001D13DC05|nr:H-2 class I histocompatibility antigen, Q9 alpha chain-like isoform X2 [Mauremys mutica]
MGRVLPRCGAALGLALRLLLLLLLGAVALRGGHSRLHSRRVLDTVVSEPGPGLPWYSRVVYVDDQVIYVYTSGMQKAEPRPVWMAQNEGPEFWEERTWWAQRHQKWFKASLNTLGQLYNQSEVTGLMLTSNFMLGTEKHMWPWGSCEVACG